MLETGKIWEFSDSDRYGLWTIVNRLIPIKQKKRPLTVTRTLNIRSWQHQRLFQKKIELAKMYQNYEIPPSRNQLDELINSDWLDANVPELSKIPREVMDMVNLFTFLWMFFETKALCRWANVPKIDDISERRDNRKLLDKNDFVLR